MRCLYVSGDTLHWVSCNNILKILPCNAMHSRKS